MEATTKPNIGPDPDSIDGWAATYAARFAKIVAADDVIAYGVLHQLYAHHCSGCGEGNLYYDRPERMGCDQCNRWCEATPLGEAFEDPALDPDKEVALAGDAAS